MSSRGARELFIHAGLPKTGTSYLQEKLHASPEALAASGLAVVPRRRHAHFEVALRVRGLLQEFDDPRAFAVLEELVSDLASCPTPRALLSHESLAPTTATQLPDLLACLGEVEVHLVLTVRDLGRQIPSGWQQSVKGRRTHSFPDFLHDVVRRGPLAEDFWRNQDLPAVLAEWAAHVPPARIHVVTCPPAGTPPTVLLDRFARLVGLDATAVGTAGGSANASLGRPQAEVLARVNTALGERLPHSRSGYRRVARSFLADRVLLPQGGTPALLPTSVRPWVEELTEEWIERLRTGGYDVVGDVEDLRAQDAAFGDEVDVVGDADLLDVTVRALADILVLRHDELERRNALRRRVEALQRRVAALEASRHPRVGQAARRGAGRLWRRVRSSRAAPRRS